MDSSNRHNTIDIGSSISEKVYTNTIESNMGNYFFSNDINNNSIIHSRSKSYNKHSSDKQLKQNSVEENNKFSLKETFLKNLNKHLNNNDEYIKYIKIENNNNRSSSSLCRINSYSSSKRIYLDKIKNKDKNKKNYDFNKKFENCFNKYIRNVLNSIKVNK
jgi:hypothetical protein